MKNGVEKWCQLWFLVSDSFFSRRQPFAHQDLPRKLISFSFLSRSQDLISASRFSASDFVANFSVWIIFSTLRELV
jgi:hypothetical protein